jgi:hypothetical protein
MAVPDNVKLYELDLFLMVYACASSYNVQFYDDIFMRLYDTLPTPQWKYELAISAGIFMALRRAGYFSTFTFRRLLHPLS